MDGGDWKSAPFEDHLGALDTTVDYVDYFVDSFSIYFLFINCVRDLLI